MDPMEREIERIDNGGNAWDEADEVVDVLFKRPLDWGVTFILTREEWDELRSRAREEGVGPNALARLWVLQQLRQGSPARRG